MLMILSNWPCRLRYGLARNYPWRAVVPIHSAQEGGGVPLWLRKDPDSLEAQLQCLPVNGSDDLGSHPGMLKERLMQGCRGPWLFLQLQGRVEEDLPAVFGVHVDNQVFIWGRENEVVLNVHRNKRGHLHGLGRAVETSTVERFLFGRAEPVVPRLPVGVVYLRHHHFHLARGAAAIGERNRIEGVAQVRQLGEEVDRPLR